jgi:hypothetical protein
MASFTGTPRSRKANKSFGDKFRMKKARSGKRKRMIINVGQPLRVDFAGLKPCPTGI